MTYNTYISTEHFMILFFRLFNCGCIKHTRFIHNALGGGEQACGALAYIQILFGDTPDYWDFLIDCVDIHYMPQQDDQ